ncbi:MAG: hypothetical protein ACLU98_03345 [Desulfovibrio fairfieldensis]
MTWRVKSIDERFGQEEAPSAGHLLLTKETPSSTGRFLPALRRYLLACLEGDHERVWEFMEWLRCGTAEYTKAYRPELFFGICRVDNPATPVREICERVIRALKSVRAAA